MNSAYYACIACKKTLDVKADGAKCLFCGAAYLVKDDVLFISGKPPQFMTGNKLMDQNQSKLLSTSRQ